jgi:hypothetical protein
MWLPYGFNHFKTFFDSYLKYPAGIQHDLIIIFKGMKLADENMDLYHQLLFQNNIVYNTLYTEGGLDIDTYFYAAQQIKTELIFFLNTSSIILNNDWLSKMYFSINQHKIGMVSATGSWHSYRSMVFFINTWKYESLKGIVYNFRKYKLMLKAAFYYPFLFKSFPNPHLRTNAFIIWKKLFLTIKWKPLTSKFRAYLCESGRNSVTNQVIRAGYDVLVVDKNGRYYRQSQWHESQTYWIKAQENLLIADNQTTKYQVASSEEKKMYTFLAWGE